MGTKNNPGQFDCLAKLAPDEPFFVLRGQDATSANLVELWAMTARILGCSPEKVAEAERVASAMKAWPSQKNPD